MLSWLPKFSIRSNLVCGDRTPTYHPVVINRRQFALLLLSSFLTTFYRSELWAEDPQEWVCPMDPDVRSAYPGVCPRCGMKLVLHVPELIEYKLKMIHQPLRLRPGMRAELTLMMFHPDTGIRVTSFDLVHEKLLHLFIVSEDLRFFAHLHPEPAADGSFKLVTEFPYSGMYRCLADYYPSGSMPQLSSYTFFVEGSSQPAKLIPSLTPSQSVNMTANIRMEPEVPIAASKTLLFLQVEPREGLEPYLGSWAHMLIASEDTIDLLHVHPTLITTNSEIQFDIVFPRPGLYKLWTQLQRKGQVNTVIFVVPVRAL